MPPALSPDPANTVGAGPLGLKSRDVTPDKRSTVSAVEREVWGDMQSDEEKWERARRMGLLGEEAACPRLAMGEDETREWMNEGSDEKIETMRFSRVG